MSNSPLTLKHHKGLYHALLLLGMLLMPGILLADGHGHRHHSHPDYRYVEYARVVRVEPVYRSVALVMPEHPHSAVIMGGLLGGAIGNSLGDANTRGFTTLAGAIIGSSLARDAYITHRPDPHVRYEQRLVGYQVSYHHHGQRYTTFMQQHPGRRIAISYTNHSAIPLQHLY